MEPESSFEASLNQLERIVDDLERGEPELSQALAKYERGVGLLAQCHGVLDKAERSIALLTGTDPSGNPLTSPFDVSETPSVEPISIPLKVAPSPTARRKRRVEPETDRDDGLIPF